jgi:hypothetical protein
LVADLTPNNLRIVQGETPYGTNAAINLPRVLKSFYGDRAGKHVTFVAILREPLSRMQSAWYAARQCGNHAICTQDCKGPSFRSDLGKALQNANLETPLYTEWLWTSMYGRHLEQWLTSFSASQFYVIPYKQYSNGDAAAICRNLVTRLSFEIDCDSEGAKPSHRWISTHPPLKDELSLVLRAAFNALMENETTRLVDVLAEGHRHGMGLANYQGKKSSRKDVRHWLEAWW